ncbi:magnesium transporter [Amorphus coralli]|uniref:magnesium transporter n=1 Tax=Amorphus coralli TaxID=340680 RepID=UPI00036A577F|nr:magnesium transporter [Amorphus coralli]
MKTVDPYALVGDVRSAVATDDRAALARITRTYKVGDYVETIESLTRQEAAAFFQAVEPEARSDVFGAISYVYQNYILRSLPVEQSIELLKDVPEQDLAKLLHKMPRTRALQIEEQLRRVAPEVSRHLEQYEPEQIGHWMSVDYFTAGAEESVRAIYHRLRSREAYGQPVVSVYIVDETHRLIDRLDLDELVRIDLDAPLSEAVDRQVTRLKVDDSVEAAVHRFQVRDAIEMPVVDAGDRLVGVIRADDIVHLSQDAFSDTLQKMGGVASFDTPYMMSSIWEQVRKRGGWLAILFVGEMLTATALTYYEAELDQAVVLALFLPLILSSGGNSGSQSSTLIIRALALKECTLGDWFRIFRRELVTGLILGAMLCAVATARITLWDTMGWADYTEHGKFSPELITFTVAIGVLGIVTWGNLVGSLLPLGIRAVRLDPAVISAPLLATFVDVTGLIIYFTAAHYILSLH